MNRSIIKMFSLLLLVMSSCSKDDVFSDQNNLGSQVEHSGSIFKSSFLIEKDLVTFKEDMPYLVAHLTSHSSNETTSNVETLLEHLGDNHRLTLFIPQELKDGDYSLRLELKSKSKACAPEINPENLEAYSFIVTFENMMVSNVALSSVNAADLYKSIGMVGLGTEEEPFEIDSTDSFNMFKFALSQDVTKGAGLYFKQTKSIKSPAPSEIYEGSYSSAYNFAGCYDGDNNAILIKYIGDEKAIENIGVFAELLDGANVENLKISYDYNDTGNCCGGLAGRCSGVVNIKNIVVDGNIHNAKSYTGGLIGKALHSTLTVEDCRIQLSIDGASYVGGVVGGVDSSSLIIDGVSNYDKDHNSRFLTRITGTGTYVGGIVGGIDNSDFNINDVSIKNSVSDSQSTTKFIYSDGGYVGGLIGRINNNTNTLNDMSTLNDISILTTVSTAKEVAGGIVGQVCNGDCFQLDNVSFGSYVRGARSVGGFFGENKNTYLKLGKGNKISMESNGDLQIGTKGETDNAGGFCGSAFDSDIIITDSLEININVYGRNSVGGCYGYFGNGTIICSYFDCSNHMLVSGTNAVGGIVGQLAGDSDVYTPNPLIQYLIDNNNQIPSKDNFTKNSNFSGTVVASESSAGGIVGSISCNNAVIKSLVFTGTVIGKSKIGGIVGSVTPNSTCTNNVSISNCANISSDIFSDNSSDTNVGGIVGYIYLSGKNTVTYCINYADINSDGSAVAGIIGRISREADNKPAFHNLINVGSIIGSGSVAGVIGAVDGKNESILVISEAANYGSINSNSGNYTAGIVAQLATKCSKISSCANHGNIHGEKSSLVAGIAAVAGIESGIVEYDNIDVRRCCNRGDISCNNKDAHIAGIIGNQGDSDIINGNDWGTYDCYNTGAIKTDHKSDTGGLVGYVNDQCHVQRSYNIGKVSHGNGTIGDRSFSAAIYREDLYYLEGSGGNWKGDSFKEADKKKEETFGSFDFDNVWAIDSNDQMNGGYPYLRDCKYQNMALSK